MEVIRKGYLLCQKGKGLDLGAEPAFTKTLLSQSKPSLLHLTNDNDDDDDNEEEEEEEEEEEKEEEDDHGDTMMMTMMMMVKIRI